VSERLARHACLPQRSSAFLLQAKRAAWDSWAAAVTWPARTLEATKVSHCLNLAACYPIQGSLHDLIVILDHTATCRAPLQPLLTPSDLLQALPPAWLRMLLSM
jgi:hypothetical protein